MVKSLRYGKPRYTAKCLETPLLKKATLDEVVNVIKAECVALCRHTPKQSILRVCSTKQLLTFRWSKVLSELKSRTPTLLSILNAAAEPAYKCRKQTASPPCAVGMAAAILLKQHNKHLCLLQTIISILLYAGHAAKRVRLLLDVVYLSSLNKNHFLF